MKDIKQKGPVGKTIKAIDKGAVASEHMKNALVKTKEKAEDSYQSKHHSPTEYASDNVSSGGNRVFEETAHTADKVGKWGVRETKNNVYKGIDKLKRSRAEKTIKSSQKAANNTIKTLNQGKKTVKQSAKSTGKIAKKTGKGTIKTVGKSVKTAEKTARTTVKTTQQTAKATQAAAKASTKAAQVTLQATKAAAKAAAVTVKATVKATIAAVKAIILALKGLIALIAAGGWIAVIIILIICMIGLIVGSGFGIFYSNDPYSENSIPITRVVTDLNTEFYDKIDVLERDNNADIVNIVSSDGVSSIKWDEVLTIFAVKTTTNEKSGMYVAQIDENKKNLLRDILYDMNKITHSVKTIQKEVTVTDDDGKETTIIISETVLTVTLTHKSYTDMIREYNFNQSQKTQAEEMLSEQNRILWAQLIGGYIGGSGQVIISGADFIPIGRFSYPLPSTFTITSQFGYRKDPITGETSYHSGLDIGADERTPILAADNGKVVAANATDSWGGGYGYYVTIEHSDGYKTHYAHCFGISVTTGQQVQKGQVIGYVGTTGRSTGNHLHFEIRKDDSVIDPLGFFKQ